MGSDIHGVVELYQGPGWWRGALDIAPFVERDYTIFSKLFGVRGPDLPTTAFRGLPDDVSRTTETLHASWESDAHSPTWVSYDEFAAYCTLYPGTWPLLLEFMTLLQEKCETDVRLVVWFDN